MAESIELPWVEKYRPQRLKEVIGQQEISKRLQSYVDHRNLPNLLFSGPAGVGKTSCAVAMARELFGNSFRQNFLELNASDDRGIDVVRNTIKDFARTMAFDAGFKIIFLDESDALTADAQQALRRTMEKYTRTVRFILSCNYSSRIIEPIQSRCVVFRFKPISAKEVEDQLQKISKGESVSLSPDAAKAVVYVSQGDMRKSINVLQAASALSKKVDEESVYNVASRARPEEVQELIELALDANFLEARKKLDSLLYEHGMSGEDVILQLYREVLALPEDKLDSKTKIALVDIIGEYNFRLVQGASERIQLEALIAQFMKFKK